VIDQCRSFPKDKHDDLHDTVTQFLNWARERGLLARADEEEFDRVEESTYRPPNRGVTELYGLS
jgi:membrane-bound lytic murein transglycosylase MltF